MQASASPILCWTSFLYPDTLVTVGVAAVAMSVGNTICLIDNKTSAKIYHKTDCPPSGAGASLLCGHRRFPLYAYSEAVLRPAVHIQKYPDITKFGTYTANGITTFDDLSFSEYEHLIGLSGYPDHSICVWNIRTGDLMVQHSTNVRCSIHSLTCSFTGLPTIMQFSDVIKEMLIWEICLRKEVYSLHEVCRIRLQNGFDYSSAFSTCYLEDGELYVVNDYGQLFNLKVNDFYLCEQWAVPDSAKRKPAAHSLCFHKLGLMVSNKETLYFIKKKANSWHKEWTLDLVAENICRFVSNHNNDIYCANNVGNLYHVDVAMGEKRLTLRGGENCTVVNFVLLKGIKEEVVLLQDNCDNLRVVNIVSNVLLSKLFVEDCLCMSAHNTFPFVGVGTKKGEIQFVSYEKLRVPAVVGTVSLVSIPIRGIRMLDNSGLVRDSDNRFHVLDIDFRRYYFFNRASLGTEKVEVMNFFMLDETNFLLLITREYKKTDVVVCANEMWVINWKRDSRVKIRRSEFVLPYNYRSLTLGVYAKAINVEMFGLRYGTSMVDTFYLRNFNELELSTTFSTSNNTHLTGVSGSRNLITWGVNGTKIHFRSHKKSTVPFQFCRPLTIQIVPRILTDAQEAYNLKYMVMHRSPGLVRSFKLPLLSDNQKENLILDDPPAVFFPVRVFEEHGRSSKEVIKSYVPTESEQQSLDSILKKKKELEVAVTNLMNYDVSVTHKEKGAFRKFCLNTEWLQTITEQSRLLCKIEKDFLMRCIADRERIRDWMRGIIGGNTTFFSSKIRALFSNSVFENYSLSKAQAKDAATKFEYFLFYDMDPVDEEYAAITAKGEDEDEDEASAELQAERLSKRYVHARNMFDHVMNPLFAVQNKDEVMANQMQNVIVKSKYYLKDALKLEFNKKFNEVHQFKDEMIESVLATNTTLKKIFDNMNCMLKLLNLETFTPEEPSVPIWTKDEVLEKILTVDDSEIKAINRRKKKQVSIVKKKARMLVWSIEFWKRALQVMMDGVLEKLWEEEIKKDVPIPEFVVKKPPHEFTVEEQKMYREYLEKVRLLAEDRRKYLRILGENERKTIEQKNSYIIKFNTRCTEMATLKLKYDFAIRQEEMRINILKLFHSRRHKWFETTKELRNDVDKITEYVEKYSYLHQFWEKSVSEMKEKMEVMITRDRTLERQFKLNFMSTVATQSSELFKLYKRRPKTSQKSFASSLVCLEVARKVVRAPGHTEFPLPADAYEFLAAVDALDDPQNMPSSMELKQWETFTKLRRSKLESEMKVKAIGYQVADFQNAANAFVKEVANLKNIRAANMTKLDGLGVQYFEIVQDRYLQVTLTMGQVEVSIDSSFEGLQGAILMNVSDINEVNDLIKAAGEKKLRAMQRVAVFRRQVLHKEWEHKVARANIEYLKYMLQIIEKCKITIEFLHILRHYKNMKDAKQAISDSSVIDRAIEEKIARARRSLDQIVRQIEDVREKIEETKKKNQQLDRSIEEIKISLTLANIEHDRLAAERRTREQAERMAKLKMHANLLATIRADYVRIMELSTILQLERLRTAPLLPPPPPDCPEYEYI